LQAPLKQLSALIDSKNRASGLHHDPPNAAVENVLGSSLKLADMCVLLGDTLPQHFAGGAFLAKRFP